MKKFVITSVCFFIVFIVLAQTSKKIKPKFNSIHSVGTVWGSSQNAFCFQTINGVSYKSWALGVGVSFDSYGSQSTPIFFDVRKQLKTGKLFFYGDVGINVPWRTTYFPKKYSGTDIDAYQLKNTLYYEAGVGLKSPLSAATNFVVSLGYSFKQFSYVQQNLYGWGIGGSTALVNYNYDFFYKRIALRLGVEF